MYAASALLAVLPLALHVPDEPFVGLDFEAALLRAEKTERVVLIDFFTTWCVPCKKLDAVTWKDPAVREWLAAHTVALKIDAEKQIDLAKRYEVDAYPSLVFIRPDGSELGRLVGYKDPAGFLEAAPGILKGVRPSDTLRRKVEESDNDPGLRQKLADELVRERRYEEALDEYLWCFDHGLEHSRSYVGVRSSFLLGSIARLGTKYPPALDALRERRDAAGEHVASRTASRDVLSDFASLNRALGEEALTLRIYDELAEVEPWTVEGARVDAREALFRFVFDELYAARRYAEIVAGVDDVQRILERRMRSFRMSEEHLADLDPEALVQMKQHTVRGCGAYYEAFAGAGDHDEEARRIAETLREFDPSPSTWDILIEHAARAERTDLVQALQKEKQEHAEER